MGCPSTARRNKSLRRDLTRRVGDALRERGELIAGAAAAVGASIPKPNGWF
jgi:hypothetical protein